MKNLWQDSITSLDIGANKKSLLFWDWTFLNSVKIDENIVHNTCHDGHICVAEYNAYPIFLVKKNEFFNLIAVLAHEQTKAFKAFHLGFKVHSHMII